MRIVAKDHPSGLRGTWDNRTKRWVEGAFFRDEENHQKAISLLNRLAGKRNTTLHKLARKNELIGVGARVILKNKQK